MFDKQKPTVGRIVHYQHGDEVQACLIVAVHSDVCINVVAFAPSGASVPRKSINFAEVPTDKHWNWPPKS